ncbi:MAG: 5-formyltetrahydrofolate cyclo-ligase [Vicingaceae bacterium]|nr:5-formyltetrahydrofolate cyclo-ligase [Vicingaceae bacterium]
MSPVIEDKNRLRKKMLEIRARLKPSLKKEYDLWVCQQLEQFIEEKRYKTIHAYLPMGKEINITPLLENLIAKGITVVTPKTLPKRKLENRVLISLTDIEKGVFGTTHPAKPQEYTGTFDLIIIPGLAFDNNNYRLGYGGGYYDNFLINHPESYKLGIFYTKQKVDNVPTESHDLPLDEILVKI